ncbi:hypothetical protein SAMN02800694_2986 [Luteibacter sp. UNCMF331Sha3.1]|uniref:hypothetical protein n=1 Tax=Luteibacter sp. UNCMF331Sha3.1 TaxID=1502760 RepID=UPI0008BB51DD|nr:hypothetical protein [Luteibacter sp. UNCMF331Sha3.1]SEN17108.1 hypothetical protein SAMN02800694_2986 [Luteibacter sp. UNCMF331Sha3.1]
MFRDRSQPPKPTLRSASFAITSRALVALIGGYLSAALYTAAMARWLPIARVEAVMTGMLSSFAIYACVAIMAFAVGTAKRAWMWLAVICVPPAIALYLSIHGVGA